MAIIEAIATTYLEDEAASVTFSSIPQTYEHLQIRMLSRNTYNYFQGSPRLTFNGAAGTAYSSHDINGTSTTVDSGRSEGEAWTKIPRLTTGNGDNNYADRLKTGDYGPAIIDIWDYRNTNKNRVAMAISGAALTTTGRYVSIASGLYTNATTVTSITLDSDGSWMRGSVFSLYGLNSS
jgi:hypothetical protein